LPAAATGELLKDEAAETARVLKIERLLDVMNVASEELNASQKAMAAIEESRGRALEVWAVCSARLAQAIGSRAAPHYRRQRQLATTRRQVAIASAAFLRASEEGYSDFQRKELAERHAKQVVEYQAAQQFTLKQSKGASSPPSWLLKTTALYFEAEAEHLAHLEEVESAAVRCGRQIASTKSRYEDALRGLEALSEAEHRTRGNIS